MRSVSLIRRSAVIRAETELVSEPSRMPLPNHVLHALERDDPEETTRHTRGNDEFHSLRDYVDGDDARMIHALRSAATGVLVRRVMQTQQQREACLILDLRRPPGRSARLGSRRLEWSLGATATIVDAMTREAASLTCLVLGQSDERWLISGPERAEDFLAFLADARPVVHRPISDAFLDEVASFDTCLWVPAGGFKASADRSEIREPVLVTEWEPIT